MINKLCCWAVGLGASFPPPERADTVTAHVAIRLIKIYQRFISPRVASACLFEPSCSNRALGFLRAFGYAEGMRLTLEQLGRCGGSFSLSSSTNGETWLLTSDGKQFGPTELSKNVFDNSSRDHGTR
jgi:putative component of membrane protein insertase Oxa1/YidC/SpoIIIJ protein YidD